MKSVPPACHPKIPPEDQQRLVSAWSMSYEPPEPPHVGRAQLSPSSSGGRSGASAGDMLDQFFGGSPRRGESGRGADMSSGSDVHLEMSLNANDAATGVTVPLKLPDEALCGACHGTGHRASVTPFVCPSCEGTGQSSRNLGSFAFSEPCKECRGRGIVHDEACPACSGSGRVPDARTIHARLPAGIADGQQVRLKGAGVPGEPQGDLYVRVRVTPSPADPTFMPRFGAHAGRWLLLYSLFFVLGLTAGVSFAGIWELLAWIWSALFGLASITTAMVVTKRSRDAAVARRYRGRFITLADLDNSTRSLLMRAQDAIAVVLGSDVYHHDMIDNTANRVILKQHEWDIATTLREISALRARVARGHVSGPVSNAVRDSYTHDQDQAQLSITSRVEALERYAAQVKIADAAYQDHQHALKLAELDEAHLKLRLRAQVQESHSKSEISDLTRDAFVTRQALLDTLIEASEAAGALALPRLGDPGEPVMATLLVERGEIHRAARRYAEAVMDFTRAIEIDPKRNDIRAICEELQQGLGNSPE